MFSYFIFSNFQYIEKIILINFSDINYINFLCNSITDYEKKENEIVKLCNIRRYTIA